LAKKPYFYQKPAMNTELEHLKYQIIAWVVALNDAQVLAQVAQTLQNAPEPEPPKSCGSLAL
jgi:hypothetical protein